MDRIFMSPAEKERLRIHKEKERQLRREKQNNKLELKIMLLGTGESGKSTFIKQMRIIHGRGFSDADRKGFTELVFQNIFRAILELIDAMETLQIDYVDDQNINHAERLRGVYPPEVTTLESWQVNAIRRVWNDPGVQKCYNRRNEFQLLDSAKYYLDDMDRITAPGYIPTLQDILRIRIPTTGIIEYMFDISNVIFRMVDVGGVRSERRKWVYSFENVTSIIFLAAISEYDQVLCESSAENRLSESIKLFKTIVSSAWFQELSTVLLLNKTDLLEEKIKHSHLAAYFPDYTGPQGDSDSAKKFIQRKFVDSYVRPQKPLYTHFSCTMDTDNIRVVLRVVKPALICNLLDKFRLE